jgi:hypothetical protein
MTFDTEQAEKTTRKIVTAHHGTIVTSLFVASYADEHSDGQSSGLLRPLTLFLRLFRFLRQRPFYRLPGEHAVPHGRVVDEAGHDDGSLL